MDRRSDTLPSSNARKVAWSQVDAFRLARHHLLRVAPPGALTLVAGDMAGAQAQVLLAAEMSIGARVGGSNLQDLDLAIWKDKTLTRAWCMRRTMYLLPTRELATFVRGSARRAEREVRWVLSSGVTSRQLDGLLEDVLGLLDRPRTQADLAQLLSGSAAYKLKLRQGGGWGSKRKVPCVEVGGVSLRVGYLLHLVGARGVICSGPSKGSESTCVRADKWISNWRDVPQERAERELVIKYLRAFGPATVSDFIIWTGMTASDARAVWATTSGLLAEVDVEGWRASILKDDLQELEEARVDSPIVRLLPYLDSYLLGHKSHRNIVTASDHREVYRPQGWVAPVVLVDGKAKGVWTFEKARDSLRVRVTMFSTVPKGVSSSIREQASGVGRFLGCAQVKTAIGRP